MKSNNSFHYILLVLVFALAMPLVADGQGPQIIRPNPIKPVNKPNPNTPRLQKKLLYTLGRNEIIETGEYFTNFKANGFKFNAILVDTITEKYTLVLNGQKILTADGIVLLSTINDRYEFSPNYWYYNKKERGDESSKEYFISIDGKTYGPYSDLTTYWNDPYGTFRYKQMDRWFRHDADGSIYPFEKDEFGSLYEDDPIFKNKNGNIRVQFLNDFSEVSYNNLKFTIPSSNNRKLTQVYFTPEGDAYFWGGSYNVVERSNKDYLKLNKNGIEFIDKDTFWKYIMRPGVLQDVTFEDVKREEDPYSFEDESMQICVQDPSKRHIFLSDWDYDYVMVDDRKIPCTAPFYAFFDPETDTFCWISLEDNQFILYSFRI